MENQKENTKKRPAADLSWGRLFIQAILAAFAYAFMEWLFYATMPSFMDAMPLGAKLEIFLITGLVLAGGALAVLIPLRILGWIPGPTKRRRLFLRLGAVLPALTAAALSLLLIDNFTYTVFRFGIVKSTGVLRAGYSLLVAVLLLLWYRQVLRYARVPAGRRRSSFLAGTASILAVAMLIASLGVGTARILAAAGISGESGILSPRRPHIVLITAEGLDSKYMSLYGYSRDTTPNLIHLAETGLLAENDYTNAAHTTGSLTSMLSGKYPADTRVLYTPNILQGEDTAEHLPGILHRAGYTNVQIAFPYYVDAYNVNMQEAFDEVNGRSLAEGDISRTARMLHWEDVGYFLPRLWERISDRLLHIFFIREMPDPYREVLQSVDPNTLDKSTDPARLENLMDTLLEAEGPVFAHVHLMDTHGPRFFPRKRVFSAGMTQDRDWMQPFYDDAMLDFDAYIGGLAADLENAGLWEDTVLVVTSDHADQWRSDDRIPLLFHFPGGEYAGRIRNNTQSLDIAPTLLDYLGMEQPTWMPGQSLLAGEPPAMRPIFSAGVVGVDCRPPDWWCTIDATLSHPPFYHFGSIQVIVCQEMDTLNMLNGRFLRKIIHSHTAPCPMDELPGAKEGRRLIIEHLRANGFDVSSLE
jgi:hypothetical protein